MGYTATDADGVKQTFKAALDGTEQVPAVDIHAVPEGKIVDIGDSSAVSAITASNANGPVLGFLAGVINLLNSKFPAAIGQQDKAGSLPVVLANNDDLIALFGGANIIGAVKNAGPLFTPIQEPPAHSADATSTPLPITTESAPGKVNCIDDIVITNDATKTIVVTIREVSGAMVFQQAMAASAYFTMSFANGLRSTSPQKAFELICDTACGIYVHVSRHDV